MAGEGVPVERLREYLRELTPEARALLVGELERGVLRTDELPSGDLILRELRRTMREHGGSSARIGNPARVFFEPFEPFLVDDSPDHTQRCRIARVSLEPIWNWISRDVMPADARGYSETVSEALLAGDETRAAAIASGFQQQVADRLPDVLARIEREVKAMGRLTMQLASRRAVENVETLIVILRHRGAFAVLGAQLPNQIKVLAEPLTSKVKQLLETQQPELLPYGLVLVMHRLAAPWQLIRLATRAAESDATVRVAATPFGAAVGIVLDEIDRWVHELRDELKSGQGIAVIALLKSIHDAVRGVRTELDLSADSPWSRHLSAIRAAVSNLVKAEIESMPGRVRRLLRPRPAAEIAPGQILDQLDVAEVETLIGLVDAGRHFASELAINEMTLRAVTEVQQYLDNGRQALLDGLRHAGDRDRAYRQSQVDAAVRFCAGIFGRDYAAVLAKAAEVAAHAERKAATA
jgi:hypothetical protein